MKKRFLILILAIVALIIYIILANMIAYNLYAKSTSSDNSENSIETGDVKLGVSEKIDVTVTRKRWYGTIIENSGQDTKLSNLYLFNIIKIPINVNNHSLYWINLIFLIIITLYTLTALKIARKREIERGFA